ncbi:MAG: CRTAC1 family protein [Pirellulaceae bacterium]
MIPRKSVAWTVALTWLVLAAASAQSPILLRDVTSRSGVTFQHTDGGSGRRYIIETVSAGLALFDYDQDGDVDIYFLNGAPLQGAAFDVQPTNALYRNDGGCRFTDVTAEAGVGDRGYGLGVAVADYDNDGAPDLYLNNYGPNVLYHSNGDGTFSDVTLDAGTARSREETGAGACFLDADKDGDLDLYVASYLHFSYDTHLHNEWLGFHVYPGPDHYLPTPDAFYVNNGDGTFTDASVASGIAACKGHGMGTVCADYDRDGDTDIFVANDSTPNFLFENDGTGKFRERGLLAGTAYDLNGSLHGSMGVDCADYDNDGRLDFYETSYQGQLAALYRNLGGGRFDDVTLRAQAGQGTLQHVTWGNGFVDFDNDGNRDLFVACGHLYDNVDRFSDNTSYRVRNILLRNTGDGRFVDVSSKAGDGMLPILSSRGAAFDDLDNDGDVDAVILNARSAPTILRNDSAGDHHWIQIRLVGIVANRHGAGAQVKVVAGDLTQVAEVHCGRSYQSHYGTRLHFGLASRDQIDQIEVRWIGGGVELFTNVEVDRIVTLKEAGGAARE